MKFSSIVLLFAIAVILAAFAPNRAHSAEPAYVPIAIPDANKAVEFMQAQAAARKLPLYILVGATYCKPCHAVASLYGPTLSTRGCYLHLYEDVHVAPVRRLLGTAIRLPTLIVIEGAKRRVFVGVDQIRLFVEGR